MHTIYRIYAHMYIACRCSQALLSSLARGGLGAQYVDDISARLWERMAAAAAINPLTALLQIRNGKLLDSPACLDIMQQVAAEVSPVETAVHATAIYTVCSARIYAVYVAECAPFMLDLIVRSAQRSETYLLL
jgi:Ketopantoate reductase PanE/ApbA C terminal